MEHWEALPQSFGQSGKQGISPRPLFLPESNQETETTWAFINSNFKTGNKLHGNGGTESQIEDREATQRVTYRRSCSVRILTRGGH